MRILEFRVSGQSLQRQPGCDFSHIVANSVDYLRLKFHFDDVNWNGCKKVIVFWENDKQYPVLLDENDSCNIPAKFSKEQRIEFSLVGGREDGYRINTNKRGIKQEVY